MLIVVVFENKNKKFFFNNKFFNYKERNKTIFAVMFCFYNY